MAERMIRPSMAARRLGVDESTIRRWIRDGRLAGWRTPGGHWRIPEVALRELGAPPAGSAPPPSG